MSIYRSLHSNYIIRKQTNRLSKYPTVRKKITNGKTDRHKIRKRVCNTAHQITYNTAKNDIKGKNKHKMFLSDAVSQDWVTEWVSEGQTGL